MLSSSTLQITNPPKKKKNTEFINYQTKNNTTQPGNINIHVNIRKLTQKKNLGNEPRKVDIGLANLGNFTFTVLCWVVTGQKGKDVGLASTARWAWKCIEEKRLSESEAMRVGESKPVRGATTMRETKRETEHEVWGRETERGYVRCEAVCCVRQWGTRVRTEKVWA